MCMEKKIKTNKEKLSIIVQVITDKDGRDNTSYKDLRKGVIKCTSSEASNLLDEIEKLIKPLEIN